MRLITTSMAGIAITLICQAFLAFITMVRRNMQIILVICRAIGIVMQLLQVIMTGMAIIGLILTKIFQLVFRAMVDILTWFLIISVLPATISSSPLIMMAKAFSVTRLQGTDHKKL